MTRTRSVARTANRRTARRRSALTALAVLVALGVAVTSALAATADFTWSPSTPVTGESVKFTSTSSGSIDDTRWDLDNDGSCDDARGTTASTTYTTTGTKTVRVCVYDDGDRERRTRSFTVASNRAPTSGFSASPQPANTGQPITLTSSSSDPDGRPLAHAWDTDNDGSFDDGSGSQVTKTFGDDGSHTVKLRVTDSGGATSTTTKSVTVLNRPPQVAFSMSASEVDTGTPVNFDANASDPDGDVVGYSWDFDGDGTTDAAGETVNRSFSDNDTYNVTLTVTDDDGARRSTSRPLTVNNRPPQAGFSLSNDEVDAGERVEFESTSTDPDGSVASHEWDFDADGTTDATGPRASHSFSDVGDRTVTLKVTDDDGATRASSREVRVRNRRPVASFTYSPSEPKVGDEVVLTSSSTDSDGEVEQHRWDLDGDGDFDDAQGPQARATFTSAGTHLVGLEVEDDDGRKSEPAFDSIVVGERPAPPSPPGGSTGSGPIANAPTANALVAPRLLAPFPSVRVRGVATVSGVRVDLLSVRTPGRTRILVRCRGRDCPWKSKRLVARFSAGVVRVVRIPGFKRRRVRAGTIIAVYVTRSGAIGKYTRIRFRRLKTPLRIDRCTVAGTPRAQRCPR